MQLRDTEYDSFTGVTHKWYLDGDKIIHHKVYDEDPFVDLVAEKRHSTAGQTFINSRKSMHHMASLPPIVIEKIMKDHHLNVMGDLSPAEQKKLYRIIETEYPWCKTHEKKLWRPTKVK